MTTNYGTCMVQLPIILARINGQFVKSYSQNVIFLIIRNTNPFLQVILVADSQEI